MTIADFLSPHDVLINLRAADKTALIADLSRRAAAALTLDAASVRGALLQREDLGSTGIGSGLAIPHARIAGVVQPFGMLVRLAKAIDFAAIDGKPVDIAFLLLSPAAAAGGHLNALASVTRRLRDPERVAQLRDASDSAELYSVMAVD